MKTTKHLQLTLAIFAAVTTFANSVQAGPGGNTAPMGTPRQSTASVVVVHTVRAAEPATCPKCARIVATTSSALRSTL